MFLNLNNGKIAVNGLLNISMDKFEFLKKQFLWARALIQYLVQKRFHNGEQDTKEQRPPEAVNMKAIYQPARQHDNQCIDHQ